MSNYQCQICEGKLIEVNGLYYKCENNHMGDSTFNMIVNSEGFKKV